MSHSQLMDVQNHADIGCLEEAAQHFLIRFLFLVNMSKAKHFSEKMLKQKMEARQLTIQKRQQNLN